MVYNIKFSPRSKQFVKKLQTDIRDRIIFKLKSIKDDPFRYLEHYSEKGMYKMRIGEFRALLDIDPKREIIFVRVIDKRSRIYKREI